MRYNSPLFLGSLVLAIGVSAPSVSHAQDPKALLLKMGQTYRSLSSLESVSTVSSRVTKDKTTLQEGTTTVILRYAKPNKLMLDIARPQGSLRAYSDGTTFYAYDVTHSLYIRGKAPTDIKGLLPLLYASMGVVANFDPLYFLANPSLPPELISLKFVGYQTYEGAPVVVVSGVMQRKEQVVKNPKGGTVRLPAITENWTWMIDRNTSLLKKCESTNTNVTLFANQKQGNTVKRTQIKAMQFSRHRVGSAKPNVAVADSVFHFAPPPGSSMKADLSKGK